MEKLLPLLSNFPWLSVKYALGQVERHIHQFSLKACKWLLRHAISTWKENQNEFTHYTEV